MAERMDKDGDLGSSPDNKSVETLMLPEVDYEKVTEGNRPHPHFAAASRSVTIQDDEETARQLRLRRQNSVGAGPRQVDTPSRVVGEFR